MVDRVKELGFSEYRFMEMEAQKRAAAAEERAHWDQIGMFKALNEQTLRVLANQARQAGEAEERERVQKEKASDQMQKAYEMSQRLAEVKPNLAWLKGRIKLLLSEKLDITKVEPELRKVALAAVNDERDNQVEKWGALQDLKPSTGATLNIHTADEARRLCKAAEKDGTLTYGHIIYEEFAEAMEAKGDDQIKEVTQLAAAVVQWLEALTLQKMKA